MDPLARRVNMHHVTDHVTDTGAFLDWFPVFIVLTSVKHFHTTQMLPWVTINRNTNSFTRALIWSAFTWSAFLRLKLILVAKSAKLCSLSYMTSQLKWSCRLRYRLVKQLWLSMKHSEWASTNTPKSFICFGARTDLTGFHSPTWLSLKSGPCCLITELFQNIIFLYTPCIPCIGSLRPLTTKPRPRPRPRLLPSQYILTISFYISTFHLLIYLDQCQESEVVQKLAYWFVSFSISRVPHWEGNSMAGPPSFTVRIRNRTRCCDRQDFARTENWTRGPRSKAQRAIH